MRPRPCTCDRCAIGEPYVKGRDCLLCWQFHNDKRYQRIWQDADPLECVHRTEMIETRICQICGGRETKVPVFYCALYREPCAKKRTTSGRKGEVRQCLTCESLNQWRRKWAVGVTTAPRKEPTLQRTLASLRKAGWRQITVFSEPDVEPLKNVDWRGSDVKLGGCPNFLRAARTLRNEVPDADYYLLVQDDVVFSSGTRTYLEDSRLPDASVLSMYCSKVYDDGRPGWQSGGRIGALTYLFRPDDLDAFLSSKHATRKTNAKIDVMVGGWALTQKGIRFHSPSLAQHIGDTSTIWKNATNAGRRRAVTFLGEEFNAMDLIRPPVESRPERIGLVGWNTPTGLGTLNRDIAANLPITDWLTFKHPRFDTLDSPAGVKMVEASRSDLGAAKKFLRGLDSVVFCEIEYVKGLSQAAKSLGVKTACVVMAEWMRPGGRGWPMVCDVMICPTKDCYRQFSHVFRRAVYVPWPVDLSKLPFKQRGLCQRFLFVQGSGGKHDRKGGEIVRKAAELANLPLIVYSQRQEGWPEHVEFRGAAKEIADLYQEGDVAVQPSRFEGLGLNLLEPLACGIPLITTDGEPMREYRTLRLVPSTSRRIVAARPTTTYDASPEALAQAMRDVFMTDVSDESREVRKWIEKERSWDVRRGEILDLITAKTTQGVAA